MGKIKDLFQRERPHRYSLIIFVNALLLYGLYFVFKNAPSIFQWTVSFISDILAAFLPLFIGLLIAYILSPFIDFIDSRLMAKLFSPSPKNPLLHEKQLKSRRLAGIILSFLIILAALFAVIYAFAVLISGQFSVGGLTAMIDSIFSYFNALQNTLEEELYRLPEGNVKDAVISAYYSLKGRLTGDFSLSLLTNVISRMGSAVINLGLGIIISIYLLKDRDLFKRLWRKLLHLTLSQKSNAVFTELCADINLVLSTFLRGAMLDALIIALLCSLALSLYGLPLAVYLGCFAGLANVIPYFGPVLGMVPVFIAGALSEGFGYGAGAVLLLLIIQQLDCNIIYPRIVGRSTGLHPLFVLLSVSVMGYYAGIPGMIAAVPIAGILKVLIIKALDRK